MCRPLKEIIAELEAKHSKKPLLYDLEERSRIISDFDKDINYLFERIKVFDKDVKFVLSHNLDVKIVSRMTINLILVMHHVITIMLKFHYLLEYYLMDDLYDKNQKYVVDFNSISNDLKKLITSLLENNIFESEEIKMSDAISKIYGGNEKTNDYTMPPINKQSLEVLNGAELLTCVQFLISFFESRLSELKLINLYRADDIYKEIYELNYLLYATHYWPAEERNFRPHIIRQRLRGKVSIGELERLRDEALHDFEYNSVPGRIWRDYSEDITQMAVQMKEQKLDDNQWKYFFSWVFKLAEYDTWIEELRNPPETEEEKEKRERLLKTKRVFNLSPAKSKKTVDILLLYKFIESRFITDTMHVYEWFALFFLLRREGILLSCTVEDFERQMNDDEWFGHVAKKCRANEINTYGFLLDKAPDVWSIKFKPEGTNKASKKAIGNIYLKYSELEDTIEEIYVKE